MTEGWHGNISHKEMRGAGVVGPEENLPGDFEDEVRHGLRERAEIKERAFTMKHDLHHPLIEYPKSCPVEDWYTLTVGADPEELPDMVERARQDCAVGLEREYQYAEKGGYQHQLRYLLECMKLGGIRIPVNAYEDGPDVCKFSYKKNIVFHLFSRERTPLDEHTLYLYGRALESGVSCDFRRDEFDFVHDTKLFEHVLDALGERASGRSLFGDVRSLYQAVTQFGGEYLNVAVQALDAHEKFATTTLFRQYIDALHADTSPLNYADNQPLLLEQLSTLDEDSIQRTVEFLRMLEEGEPGRRGMKYKYDELAHLVALISKHADRLFPLEHVEDFVLQPQLKHGCPSDIILYLVHASNRFPLHVRDRQEDHTKRQVATSYARELVPEAERVCMELGVPFDSLEYGSLQDDIPSTVARTLWPLQTLAEDEVLRTAVADSFSPTNANELADIARVVLSERVSPSFLDRVYAARAVEQVVQGGSFTGITGTELLRWGDKYSADFIRWLATVCEETGKNIIHDIRTGNNGGEGVMYYWKQCYEHQDMYRRAKAEGFFEVITQPSMDSVAVLLEHEDVYTFVRNQGESRDEWLMTLLLRPEEISHVKAWIESGLYDVCRDVGLLNGVTFHRNWQFLLHRERFSPLLSLTKEERNEFRALYQRMQSELGLRHDVPVSDLPVEFMVAALRDPRLFDMAIASKRVSEVNYGSKFTSRDVFADRLEWTMSVTPDMREDFLTYLRSADVPDGLVRGVTQKDLVFLSAQKAPGDVPDDATVESAWQRETASWRERRKVLDFLESTDFVVSTQGAMDALVRLAKVYDMREAGATYTHLTKAGVLEGDAEERIRSFEVFVNHFGLAKSPALFTATNGLMNGVYPERGLCTDGVRHVGEQGVHELRESTSRAVHELIAHEDALSLHSLSTLDRETFRYVLRVDSSTWSRPGISFEQVWDNLEDATAKGEAGNLPHGYEAHDVALRSAPRELKLDQYEMPFQKSLSEILSSSTAGEFENVQRALLQEVEDDMKAKTSLYEEGEAMLGSDSYNERKQHALEGQIKQVRTLSEQMINTHSPEQLLQVIARSRYNLPTFQEHVAALVLRDTLETFPDWKVRINELSRDHGPSVSAIQTLREFYSVQLKDHALGLAPDGHAIQDGMLYEHLSKKERKAIARMVKRESFDNIDDVVRAVAEGEVIDRSYRFVPSRGILGEMSGYLADACWTSQMNIVRDNQNMVPVVCVEQDGEIPSLRGAFLLFENSVEGGKEKVLVLRGVNPQDGLLDTASADSFCTAVIEYAEEVARARGCSRIVASSQSGIISNRPSVASYFAQRLSVAHGPMVGLDTPMRFNGYDITNRCQTLCTLDSGNEA